MRTGDAKSLQRIAQFMLVEGRKAVGSPPAYDSSWQPVYNCTVSRIEIGVSDTPSKAVITFPGLHWHESGNLSLGDIIRIRTAHSRPYNSTIVFEGYITSRVGDFFGGSAEQKGHDMCGYVCHDIRWLMAKTSPVFGQYARGPDNYTNYGTPSQSPIAGSATFMSARRTIFNNDGPNMDPVGYVGTENGLTITMPLFAEPSVAQYWTCRQMLGYCLSRIYNRVFNYFPLTNASQLTGLDDDDWDKVLNHVVIDSQSNIAAAAIVAREIGWSFRLDFYDTGPQLVFFKTASAAARTRTSTDHVILHELYAPAVGEDISYAVAAGKKMVWQANIAEDIADVVNAPFGLGAIDRFEFTAELVPAWEDGDLAPDTDNLYFTQAELADENDPDQYDFFKYYHTAGSSLRRDVGRKWALNESGRYSSAAYDRGLPFDFATVIPASYILDTTGNRAFGGFDRQLLPCLTFDKDSLNSVGIRVEFSFDGGSTWQQIACSIQTLASEAGIYIADPNLSELIDKNLGTISGGVLDGEEVNYFVSLCDDKLNSRSFKSGNWHTRVRVTASVQLDQRLRILATPTGSGSPFEHRAIYNLTDYTLQKRTESSIYSQSALDAWDTDESAKLAAHLGAIRDANQDMAISGAYTLERLWLGDGEGVPDFAIGDCIERIAGREKNLSATINGQAIYPEIIKIIYLPPTQQTQLVTRDMRFAEVHTV